MVLPGVGGFSGLAFSCGWFVRFVAVWGGFGLGVLGLGGNFCGFRFVGFVGVGLLLWGLAVLVVFAVVLVFSFVLILSVLSGFLCGLAHCILLVGLVGFSVYCACGCLCVSRVCDLLI